MQGKRIGLNFAEDVGIVMVLFGNMGEVGVSSEMEADLPEMEMSER